jgi:hypothetical protein
MLETVSDSKIKDLFLDFIKGWLDEYKQPKYRVQLNNIIQRGGNSLIIDYSDLSRYNSDLAALATKDPKYLEIFSKSRSRLFERRGSRICEEGGKIFYS